MIVLPALEAHLHAMAEARQRGDLHTVRGHQYPVPEGAFMRWEAERRELRRKRAASFLKTISPRYEAERAFA